MEGWLQIVIVVNRFLASVCLLTACSTRAHGSQVGVGQCYPQPLPAGTPRRIASGGVVSREHRRPAYFKKYVCSVAPGERHSGAISASRDLPTGRECVESVPRSFLSCAGALLVRAAAGLVLGGQLMPESPVSSPPRLACVLLMAGLWLHRFCCGPLELLRGPDQIGQITEQGRSRTETASEVRRRPHKGRPASGLPNRWYQVVDSHLMQRGNVRNATVLGE
ncbi:hypothetical protein NDU88_000771 [Pleurodeles waltl]|uniref:Secreted protein n=1 Tax=Pleurodeles waltl TaxID=8319 RepID=A0AAV7LZ27_PLEWA|nr:hypothetical protein NDU88_000771 [Pleurodeles waltl]